MISLVDETSANFLVHRYLGSMNTDYVLRLLHTYKTNSRGRLYLFSYDFMNDNYRDCTLISYHLAKCACDRCGNRQNRTITFLQDGILHNLCITCLPKMNYPIKFGQHEHLISQNLMENNYSDDLERIFSNWDTEFYYFGYRVRNVLQKGIEYFYLDMKDRYGLTYGINESEPKVFSQARSLYLYNYFTLLKSLNKKQDREFFLEIINKNFSQEELKDFITLGNTSQNLVEQSQNNADLVGDHNISVEHNKNKMTHNKRSRISDIRSKPCASLKKGETCRNARVKLMKVRKDNRGFFKGNYNNLYLLFYGRHLLLWNTNSSVKDGNYSCTFKVVRNTPQGYTFVNHCRLKKI